MDWSSAARWAPVWRTALLFGLTFFAVSWIGTQTRATVDRQQCSTTSGSSGRVLRCAVYTETYHGGIFVIDASLSQRATGTTAAPMSMKPTDQVRTGFHPLALLGQLVICLLLGVPVAVLIALLAGRRGLRRLSRGARPPRSIV